MEVFFVWGDEDGNIIQWDLKSGAMLKTFKGGYFWVWCLASLEDGTPKNIIQYPQLF